MINDNLLITDSSEAKTEALLNFLESLRKNGFKLSYYGRNKELDDFFKATKQKSNDCVWPKYPTCPAKHFFYWLLLPISIVRTLYAIHDEKPKNIITTGLSDTIIMSLLNRAMKFNHYWLLLPELEKQAYKFRFSKKIIKAAHIYCYSSLTKNRLEQLGLKNKCSVLLPSYSGLENKHQENIFNTLAQKDNPRRKFFTIGTFAELTAESHLETLLKAAKEIREVIPNLQIIIVGDGPEKKNLLWLAKTLGIESTVWFVGSTDKAFKWLENLDLYIHTKPNISLKEQLFALEIMSRGLPLIADVGAGLDDLIFDGKTGQLIIFKNVGDLVQAIINIEQDRKLLESMGNESKKRVSELFNPQKALDQFIKVL